MTCNNVRTFTGILYVAAVAAAFALVGVPLASAHGNYATGYYGSANYSGYTYGDGYRRNSSTSGYSTTYPGVRTYPQIPAVNTSSYSTNGRIVYVDGIAQYDTGSNASSYYSGSSDGGGPGYRCYPQVQSDAASSYDSSGRIEYTNDGIAYFDNEGAPYSSNSYNTCD